MSKNNWRQIVKKHRKSGAPKLRGLRITPIKHWVNRGTSSN